MAHKEYAGTTQANWNSAGAIAGGLAFANQIGLLGGGCGNGINLGGNRCGCGVGAGTLEYVSELQARIQGLEAQRYSDNADKAVYQQTLADNKSLREELFAFLTPLSNEAASNRERVAVLEAQAKCDKENAALREQIVIGKINELGAAVNGRFSAVDQTIACIAGKVNAITKVSVFNDAVCPGWGPVCVQPAPCPNSSTSTSTSTSDS